MANTSMKSSPRPKARPMGGAVKTSPRPKTRSKSGSDPYGEGTSGIGGKYMTETTPMRKKKK